MHETSPTQDQAPIVKVFESRQVAQERATSYGEALRELVDDTAKLRGAHLIISGLPYAHGDSPIYGDREHFRITEQQVRVRDAYVSEGKYDDAERPIVCITITLPYGRGYSHEPMSFRLHELEVCRDDESPAENYYTGEIMLD